MGVRKNPRSTILLEQDREFICNYYLNNEENIQIYAGENVEVQSFVYTSIMLYTYIHNGYHNIHLY